MTSLATDVAVRYQCDTTGIDIGFTDDSVPVEMAIPGRLFGVPHSQLAALLMEALNTGALYCQQQLAAESDFPDDAAETAPVSLPVDFHAGLERLGVVADLFTDAHHTLMNASSTGTEPLGLVEATANAAGTVVALEFSPQLAANGPQAACRAIVTACAEAIRAANAARAQVIEHALGAVLHNSVAANR